MVPNRISQPSTVLLGRFAPRSLLEGPRFRVRFRDVAAGFRWVPRKRLFRRRGRTPLRRSCKRGGSSLVVFFGVTPELFPSLPEFLDFKLFGKTILVVNRKFELFLAHSLRK